MVISKLKYHFEHMRRNALDDHYDRTVTDKDLIDRLAKLREMETEILSIITSSAKLSTSHE